MRVTDKSIAVLSQELGVSQQTLRNWRRQAQEVNRPGGERLTGDEREELKRLRRENRTLQMEREVLKRTAAFFAKESEAR
jgi:transposase